MSSVHADDLLADLTRHLHRLERRAQTDREHFEDLFSLVSDGYIATDSAGIILDASASALAMLDVETHSAIGQPLTTYLYYQDRSAVRSALASMRHGMLDGGDWTLRLLPRGEGGVLRVVQASARVWRHTSGRIECVRWLLRDFTEQGMRDQELLEARRQLTLQRERADLLRQLAEHRARLGLAMEAAEMGHWEWDLDSGAAVWDAVHNRIIGLPETQVSGSFEELLEHVHPDDRQHLRSVVQKAGEQNGQNDAESAATESAATHSAAVEFGVAECCAIQSTAVATAAAETTTAEIGACESETRSPPPNEAFEIEFRTLHPNGAVRWAMARGRVYRDRDGRRRMLGVMRDVTAAKESQAALLRTNQQLEDRVRQRTRVLMDTQTQLQSLAAQLSRAEERERRRIAVGLHDRISQPLAMARMALGQLRAAAASSATAGLAGGLAAPLADLESLLAQAIEESRTLTFELSPPILHELGLKAALEWLAEQSQRRHGLRVELRVGADIDEIAASADLRGLLFQAARELLANIAKHARARHAVISARRCRRRVRLTVLDDGRGFDPPSPANGSAAATRSGPHAHGAGTNGTAAKHSANLTSTAATSAAATSAATTTAATTTAATTTAATTTAATNVSSGGSAANGNSINGAGATNGIANGSASAASAAGLRGFGLFHLKTRAEQIGGRLRLRSRGGFGSAISLIVPIVISPIVVPDDERARSSSSSPSSSASQPHASSQSASSHRRSIIPHSLNSTQSHEPHNRTDRGRSPDRAPGTSQPPGHSPGPERDRRGSRRTVGDRDGQAA